MSNEMKDKQNGFSDERNVREATAFYQSEFPAKRQDEAEVTRREFCNFLGVTSAALFAGAVGFAGKATIDARAEEKSSTAKIEGAERMLPGTALNFRYPTEKDTAILVRAIDGSYYAYGQKCTHLSCPVYYESRHGQLECPCHEGSFDIRTGNVIAGPPPRPLDQIELEVKQNGEVWATGRKQMSAPSAVAGG
jgi:Rieske Fe-S protein